MKPDLRKIQGKHSRQHSEYIAAMFTHQPAESRQLNIKTEGSKLSRFQLPEINKEQIRTKLVTDNSISIPLTPIDFSKTVKANKPLGFQLETQNTMPNSPRMSGMGLY